MKDFEAHLSQCLTDPQKHIPDFYTDKENNQVLHIYFHLLKILNYCSYFFTICHCYMEGKVLHWDQVAIPLWKSLSNISLLMIIQPSIVHQHKNVNMRIKWEDTTVYDTFCSPRKAGYQCNNGFLPGKFIKNKVVVIKFLLHHILIF